MNVNLDAGSSRHCQVVVYRLSGNKRERRCPRWFSQTRMTECAHIHLPVSGEFRRIDDGGFLARLRLRGVAPNVFPSRAVASFAGKAEHEPGLVIAVQWRTQRFEVSGMALHTPRRNASAEICISIPVSRAIDPLSEFGPERQRKLKQLISLPVKVSLSFSARADHDVEAFRARCRVGGNTRDRRLELALTVGLNLENQFRIGSLERVASGPEVARDRVQICDP